MSITTIRKIALPLLLLVALSGGFWLLPLRGQIIVALSDSIPSSLWPQMRLEPPTPYPGQTTVLWITDNVPWANVRLTVGGTRIQVKDWWSNLGGTSTWQWVFAVPDSKATTLVFYHSCQSGCVKRGEMVLGTTASQPVPNLIPTKLGVVFADPKRDWHGRSGWDVELTYSRLADQEYWGVDDLAERVEQAISKGLRVMVRADYAQGQSLPPANDYLALAQYLEYLQRLARDDRLESVYGYIIGSSYNETGSNSFAPERPVTPEWYARIFNGFGEPAPHSDNAIQAMRLYNPRLRVLVGPLRPWSGDQNGRRPYVINVPWLNYMNTLVAALDEAARSKAAAGISLMEPDGFAVQAPGRPGAPELDTQSGAEEPRMDLRRSGWGEAQGGFRVYRDWLSVINSYPTTAGLPVYISATNTFTVDENVPPAQNYPRGWLTAALDAVDRETQVRSLVWFVDEDRSGDARWDWFSLAKRPGRLTDAAAEFDALLQRQAAGEAK